MPYKVLPSLILFLDALREGLNDTQLLERWSTYFDTWAKTNSWNVTTWLELRLAIRDAQTYLLRQPAFFDAIHCYAELRTYTIKIDEVCDAFLEARSANL